MDDRIMDFLIHELGIREEQFQDLDPSEIYMFIFSLFGNSPKNITDEKFQLLKDKVEQFPDEILNGLKTLYTCPYCSQLTKSGQSYISVWGLSLRDEDRILLANVSVRSPYIFHKDCFLPFMEGKIIEVSSSLTPNGIHHFVKENNKNEN